MKSNELISKQIKMTIDRWNNKYIYINDGVKDGEVILTKSFEVNNNHIIWVDYDVEDNNKIIKK